LATTESGNTGAHSRFVHRWSREQAESSTMHKLNVLKPSVNNMTVRVFLRAAGLEFSEVDVYGQTRSPEFLKKCPAHLTPMLETGDLPKGGMWESCAIMQYLCNKHGLAKFYPTDPARRAMIDSAMFYLVGTLYPLVARATYPALGFPLYPGEVGASDASDAKKDEARKAAMENALRRARLYAAGAGAEVGQVLTISEDVQMVGPRPLPMTRTAMALAAAFRASSFLASLASLAPTSPG